MRPTSRPLSDTNNVLAPTRVRISNAWRKYTLISEFLHNLFFNKHYISFTNIMTPSYKLHYYLLYIWVPTSWTVMAGDNTTGSGKSVQTSSRCLTWLCAAQHTNNHVLVYCPFFDKHGDCTSWIIGAQQKKLFSECDETENLNQYNTFWCPRPHSV